MLNKIIKVLVIILLIIIILAIVIIVYIWLKNPYGLKGVLQYKLAPQSVQMDKNYDHPLLSTDQENQLRSVGLDPAKLPTELTPEQASCLQGKLGTERSAEILKGSSPSTSEILKAASCL